MRRTIAATFVLAGVATGLASGATSEAQLNRDGVVAHVPTGWQLTIGRVNSVLDPVTVFTVSTVRLRGHGTSDGHCSPILQRAWRADSAYVQLAEERDGASRKRLLARLPHRPVHFVLGAKGAGGLCTPAGSGQLAFQEGGRAFYVYYGFGSKASKATHAQAAALLDTMRIEPL